MQPPLLDIPTQFASERLLLRCYRASEGAMYYQMKGVCVNEIGKRMAQLLTGYGMGSCVPSGKMLWHNFDRQVKNDLYYGRC